MAKSKPQITLESYGIYSKWDKADKALPQITQFTTQVKAELDIEFGLIVNIKKAKGEKLHYCIYHPGIIDADGEVMQPFEGNVYVKDNDWSFYLGDTVWEPIEDKIGNWRMTLSLAGKVIADKTFNLTNEQTKTEDDFWKHRGY
ncbi:MULTISPECIES: DUF3859 domain-containing protein [unclassified Pseudoalteromonas]|uniref:DUF3859 domain-containing protein n=1 Tax=unclassified Pseudoalteromonas TaxID=194690 RepID=UPI00110AB6C2|nr:MULTISPECIES: DUF3859 domain-containing protein [unclassified Pseudoalteromonas]NWL16300.1 DUF3859 domain-containing protein [Pseudoalteromonas sp. Scap03]QLE81419.1 DUF3859 domain-containing protein [Pseudoalteromonas sp. Scap25]QLE89363.1 DUF3859 domain-containing protein [Pseudoalteromonas sp. Scap06]TMP76386.1 DUF3859 domain-containing protein [Pseudoalteromonas sp. S1608]